MISAGIVVEYNPFHNGHLHHVQETKKRTNADVLIAVMSGNFLQRGEPAIVSKFSRTYMALKAGIDIVIELPYCFATQKAEIFAKGALQLLSSLHCQFICFGSESGNIDDFWETINFIEENDETYQNLIKYYIKKGVSYPKATSLSFQQLNPTGNVVDLTKPNNILGYHYMKAIKDQNLAIVPITIPRREAQYHDEDLPSQTIASATSIRKRIVETNSLDEVIPFMPQSSYEELLHFQQKYQSFANWENYWPYLKFRIISSSASELKEIYEVEEGIENRIISEALKATSFSQFMSQLKSKRYTWTRLSRLCTHILTNCKKEEMKKYSTKPHYARLLGFSQKGRQYLKEKKEKFSLPIIANLASFKHPAIKLDIKASYVYSFGFPKDVQHVLMEQEYKQPPIMLE